MAYATAEDVAAYMGRQLTSTQLQQAAFFLDAASAWIDQHTGKTWNPSSPTTELVSSTNGDYIYLSRKPVATVTLVRIRPPYVGSAWITVAAASGYEIVDLTRGLIRLSPDLFYGPRFYFAEITYTHTASVPPNVKLVAILLAAHKLNSAMNPLQQRVRSMNDNRAVSVTFRDEEVPPEVHSLLPPRVAYIV